MRSIRPGTTLLELALTLAVTGILLAVAVPRAGGLLDRLGVRGASQDVSLALALARAGATRRGDYVSFVADSRTGRIRVRAGGETLFERDLARTRGVRLDVTRESLTLAPTGLGWGPANTTVVVSRGGRADTIVTSRLGRVRKG